MYVLDSQFSELPMHVTIASAGSSVLAFGYAHDFGTAVAWCDRAMQLFAEADQGAIASPTLTEWPGFGKVPMVIPEEGWTRSPRSRLSCATSTTRSVSRRRGRAHMVRTRSARANELVPRD